MNATTETQCAIKHERDLLRKQVKVLVRQQIKAAQLAEELMALMEQHLRLLEQSKPCNT